MQSILPMNPRGWDSRHWRVGLIVLATGLFSIWLGLALAPQKLLTEEDKDPSVEEHDLKVSPSTSPKRGHPLPGRLGRTPGGRL